MRRLLLALVLFLAPVVAHAQIPSPGFSLPTTCGDIKGSNLSWKSGNFGWFINYSVSTSRGVNLCWMDMSVAARIEGVSDSGMSGTGVFTATAARSIGVEEARTYNTLGSHGWIWYVAPFFFATTGPDTLSSATITAEEWNEAWPEDGDDGDGGDDDEEDEPRETACNPMDPDAASPLIFDLAHDGFHLTSVDEGVLFDLDGDGDLDRVAWTRADSDDAWLAMDRNGNGLIDDGKELFGNHTPGFPNPVTTTANGFEALKFLETGMYGFARPNAVIDAQDAAFGRLLLWRDLNHDGISQADELKPLGASVQAIYTSYKESHRHDAHGNEFRQRAKASFSDGDFFVYDVWLKRTQ